MRLEMRGRVVGLISMKNGESLNKNNCRSDVDKQLFKNAFRPSMIAYANTQKAKAGGV
jgi:hypothetical protein